jgi:hypothetical protein
MRMADIEVGTDYAHRAHSWSIDASRVGVREKLTGARVRVKVLEPADGAEQPLRRGAVVDVTSRSLVSSWTDWPELAAAEQRTRDEETARRKAHQLEVEQEEVADPSRTLPDKYDKPYFNHLVESTDDLRDWPIPAPHLSWRTDRRIQTEAALSALRGLPVYLARDLLAAAAFQATEHPPEERIPGSVGFVLGPLASALIETMDWVGRGSLVHRLPDHLLSAAFDFTDACAAAFAERGGCLRLPETPPLERTAFPGPGWLRVRYAPSTGTRIHAPDCHVLKSQKMDPIEAPTWPAWHLNLPGSDPCANCGGPWLAATPALLGFLTAATVWLHRSRGALEKWQLRACLMLLAEAAQARAVEVEPDRDWVGQVVTVLLADRPGDKGWDAYKPLLFFGGDFRDWHKARQKAALNLAYRRLALLHDALPVSIRPGDRPSEPDQLPGNADGRRQTIQSWYESLKHACVQELPDLDLLLFGLPGANKWS